MQNLQELLQLAHQLESTLPGNTSDEKELAIRKIFVRSKSGQVVFETKKSKPWYKRLFQGPSYDIEKNYNRIKSLYSVLQNATENDLRNAFSHIKANEPEKNLDEAINTLACFQKRLNSLLIHVALSKEKDLSTLEINWIPKETTVVPVQKPQREEKIEMPEPVAVHQGWFASMLSTFAWGGAKAAEAAGSVAKELVVPLHVLPEKLDAKRAKLNELTESHVASVTTRVIAQYAASYLEHQVIHAKEIDPTLKDPWAKELLVTNKDQQSEYSVKGKLVCDLMRTRKEFITESIENNVLTGTNNVMSAFKAYQEKNPYFLVDLLRETFEEVSSSMQPGKTRTELSDKALFDKYRTEFRAKLTDALLNIAYPNGAADLELDVVGGSWLKNMLWGIVSQSIAPVLVDMACAELTSSATRDAILFEAFSLAQSVLAKSAAPRAAMVGEKKELPPYEGQERFNNSFSAFTFQLLNEISPKLVKDLGKIVNVKEKLALAGPAVVKTIAGINLMQAFNTGMQRALESLNPGGKWEGKERTLDFKTAPFVFASTPEEVKKLELAKEVASFQKRVELENLQKLLGKNLENLIELITTTLIGPVEARTPDELLSMSILGTWSYMARLTVNTLARRCVKKFVQLGAKARRWKSKVNLISEQALIKSQSVQKESVIAPLIKTISKYFK